MVDSSESIDDDIHIDDTELIKEFDSQKSQ